MRSILLAKILFLNSTVLRSLRQQCAFPFHSLISIFVAQHFESEKVVHLKKKAVFFFFFFGMLTVRDNLEDTLGVLKSPAPVMGGRVCFRSYFFFFPLQKSWLSSSKKNNHILKLIGMLAVSWRGKEKKSGFYLYSMMKISQLREIEVHSSILVF